MPQLTNATKAAIILALNSAFAVALAFNAPVSEDQFAAISVAVNALLGVYVAFTYRDSPKRIPDA